MRTIGFMGLVLAAVFLCLHLAAPDADAARLGGGKSFGGKPSYSRSAPAPRNAQPANSGVSADRRNQAAQPGAMARPGMSGMRGVVGGLLAGTLIGSLLFGGPFGGPGIADIVLFALLAFLLLSVIRVMRTRRAAEEAAAGKAAALARARGPNPWEGLRGEGGSSAGGVAAGPDIRLADFDPDDFLRGAKMLFVRLQGSWDRRDIEDIAAFTTPAVYNEIKAQAEADPGPSVTEIIMVNASLVAAERDGEADVATVYFDALVRENQDAETPAQARELWHFTRPAGSAESWRLDGIQQVE